MKVLKFGGTSVATAESRRACVKLVAAERAAGPVVVVVSALDGVTERLGALARSAAGGNRREMHRALGDLRELHAGTDDRLLDELERVVGGLAAIGELTPRSRDLVLSFGERMSAPILAAGLGEEAVVFDGGEAGIVTDERWGEASPLAEVTRYELRRRLAPVLDEGKVPVVTGFLGATQHGVVTTLGRGGSDFTATLVGAALGASEVWLCSDVEGLRAADPRIVPDAAALPAISFAEALEMVQFGAKGIHPRALEPAVEHGIPVRIVNTLRPEAGGTLIGPAAPRSPGPARSVHLVAGMSLVTVTGAVMVGRPGTAARLFQAVAEAGANVRMISQSVSESGISLAVARGELERVRTAVDGALVRPGYVRGVRVDEDVAIVAVVGEAMRGTPGVAARVFGAVARAGVNVIAIAQGPSELSISFIVEAGKGAEAVRALYEAMLK